MDMKILSPIIPFIHEYGYIAIMITGMIEGSSIPFPGSIVLVIVGFIIALGKINIWLAIFLGAFCYTMGSIIPYYIGKNIKEDLFHFLVKYGKVPKKKIVSMEESFYKYGDISICITRPLFMGNYISYLAGIAHIHLVKFILYTFFGILPWMGLYLSLGYFFKGNLQKTSAFLDKYNIYIVGIFLGIGLLILLWKWKGKELFFREKNS